MKNPYAKTVKLFSKAESLFIDRRGDTVFLCEGHIIVKLHVVAYDAFFRPASGQFLEMADGEKASRRGDTGMPEKSNAETDIAKLFEGMEASATAPVHASPFLMEFTDMRGKNALQRMFTGDGYYIAINNAFYELAQESGLTEFWNAGSSIQPVVAHSGEYNGIAILPIRLNQEKIADFVNVVK